MRYILIILLMVASYLVYKAYDNAISSDVEFDMSELVIMKKGGGEVKLKIKVADAINEQRQGLMGIREMGEDEGMLFIFENEQMRKMWMDNTYIPLDMMFISAKKTIFNFKENAEPLSRSLIYSVGPAQYVLEVNAGFVKHHNITVGDKIEYEIK